MRQTHTARLLSLALLAPLAFTQGAQAITFEQLNAAGSGSGVFYTPNIDDWVLAPASADSSVLPTSSGWLLSLGQSSFGASEFGSQPSNIYGAGLVLPESAYGWRVDFSANLRTWDAYNDGNVVSPNAGGSLGDWDLFTVNMNQNAFYWNLTSEGIVTTESEDPFSGSLPTAGSGLIDPLIPVRPAGSVVTFDNTANDSQYLPGSTWAWGGRDYAAGYFESVQTNGSIQSGSGGSTYVSFVLDTRTPISNDSGYPSWGQFGTAGVFANVPDGASNGGATSAPGFSMENPLLPIGLNEAGGFVFTNIAIGGEDGLGLDNTLFIDPEVAIGYEFEITAGSPAFKKVFLPSLGDVDGYTLEVKVDGVWTAIANVADGGSFEFDSTDTFAFRVTGINPELSLNPSNFAAFVTGVLFSEAGTVSLTMTPITAAVPEPGTAALSLMGLAGLMMLRRRKN